MFFCGRYGLQSNLLLLDWLSCSRCWEVISSVRNCKPPSMDAVCGNLLQVWNTKSNAWSRTCNFLDVYRRKPAGGNRRVLVLQVCLSKFPYSLACSVFQWQHHTRVSYTDNKLHSRGQEQQPVVPQKQQQEYSSTRVEMVSSTLLYNFFVFQIFCVVLRRTT